MGCRHFAGPTPWCNWVIHGEASGGHYWLLPAQQVHELPPADLGIPDCCPPSGQLLWVQQLLTELPGQPWCATLGLLAHSSRGQSLLPAALQVLAGAYPASLDDEETDRVLFTLLELGISTFVCLQAEVSLNTPEKSWRTGRGLRSACVPCGACPSVPHQYLLYWSTSCPALLLQHIETLRPALDRLCPAAACRQTWLAADTKPCSCPSCAQALAAAKPDPSTAPVAAPAGHTSRMPSASCPRPMPQAQPPSGSRNSTSCTCPSLTAA